MRDFSPKTVLSARSDAETDDEYILLERRVLLALYQKIPPFHVMFNGNQPLADPHAREMLREWCSENDIPPSTYLLSPKRSIYFQSETDAMLCRITFA